MDNSTSKHKSDYPKNERTDLSNCDQVLEQWQTCVELANSFSARRDTVNGIYVSLNVALLAGIGLTIDAKTTLLSIVGSIVSFVWLLAILYYRQISKAKYTVIIEMEKLLPTSPLKDEWDFCKNRKTFIEGTLIELLLPILFMVVYVTVLLSKWC